MELYNPNNKPKTINLFIIHDILLIISVTQSRFLRSITIVFKDKLYMYTNHVHKNITNESHEKEDKGTQLNLHCILIIFH